MLARQPSRRHAGQGRHGRFIFNSRCCSVRRRGPCHANLRSRWG